MMEQAFPAFWKRDLFALAVTASCVADLPITYCLLEGEGQSCIISVN